MHADCADFPDPRHDVQMHTIDFHTVRQQELHPDVHSAVMILMAHNI
jgi:hypothetical protein